MTSKYGKFVGNEIEYIKKYLDTEDPNNKNFPWVQKFEEEFTKLSGAKYAIAVNSATSGLHAALEACNLSPGDEVISSAITVVMNSFVTIQSNLTPVFADINPNTWNIDIETIKSKVTDKTKVIMPVSLFGLPVDIEPIMNFAKEKNIIVIDDNAETIMGEYKKKFAGVHADISVYSFENKKHMTSGGEGGMVITSNEKLAKNIRKFSGIGYKNLTASAGRVSMASSEFQDPNHIRHDTIGLNYRMTPLSAAIGLAQLERIKFLVERRIEVAEMFLDATKNCSWMIPQKKIEAANHTYFTVAFNFLGNEKKLISWKEFYNMYLQKGGDGFYSAWMNPYLETALKNRKFGKTSCNIGLCPSAEKIQKNLMLFKTNYRNLDIAKRKANLLSSLIDEIGRD